MKQLLMVDFGPPLHCLVIVGKTHPVEEEMLDFYTVAGNPDQTKEWLLNKINSRCLWFCFHTKILPTMKSDLLYVPTPKILYVAENPFFKWPKLHVVTFQNRTYNVKSKQFMCFVCIEINVAIRNTQEHLLWRFVSLFRLVKHAPE